MLALTGTNVDDCVEILMKCYETVIQRFDLMAVTTDDINEAFIIFETLNARGKDLETADLLKNYIFRQAGNNIQTVKTKWLGMLDALVQKDDATKFIRYYWNATHSFTREKDLYKKVSKTITASKCNAFVTELNSLADLYNALSCPEDNRFYSNHKITEALINLSVMKAATFYPLIIAMQLKDFSEADILNVLQAIEVLVFRNFVVGGQTANRYEIFFSKIACQVSGGSLDKNEIIHAVVQETNDDDEFKRNLVGLEIKAVPIAKYTLREIEDFGSEEKKISKDNNKINLEHIMPKNNSQWKVDAEEHSKYLYRLANQTLLLDEYNKSISNKVFATKKQMYAKSEINMTKRLCDYSDWDAAAINQREEELKAVILKRWALPKFTMQSK